MAFKQSIPGELVAPARAIEEFVGVVVFGKCGHALPPRSIATFCQSITETFWNCTRIIRKCGANCSCANQKFLAEPRETRGGLAPMDDSHADFGRNRARNPRLREREDLATHEPTIVERAPDGRDFPGSMGPYGDLERCVVPGSTAPYAFSSGSMTRRDRLPCCNRYEPHSICILLIRRSPQSLKYDILYVSPLPVRLGGR